MLAKKTWIQRKIQDTRLRSYHGTAGADFSRSNIRHVTSATLLVGRSAWVSTVAVVLSANIGCWST